ncbi:MAG: ATPase, partial [Bacteroidetes bacterium]
NNQEIDWIEETEKGLNAFEIKWNPKSKARVPSQWQKAYGYSHFQVIDSENFLDFITDT